MSVRFARATMLAIVAAVVVVLLAACAGEPTVPPTKTATSPAPTVTALKKGDPCNPFRALSASAGGADVLLTVTSYRCGPLHVDSTGQRSQPNELRATAGEAIKLDFGAALIPTVVEVRLYEGDQAVASFLRWPDDLPGGQEAVQNITIPVGPGPQFVLDSPPGVYTLVVHAHWILEAETFFALGLTID